MDEHTELNGVENTNETTDTQPLTADDQANQDRPTSIDPHTPPIAVSEADIEPETSSDMTAQLPAADTELPQNMAVEEQETAPQEGTAIAAPAAVVPAAEKSNKQFILLAVASLVLVVVVAVVVAWLLSSKEVSSPTDNTSSVLIEQPKLGVAITVADGSVELLKLEGDWQAATTNSELQEGDSIRTLAGSRAVLTLDDGSAIRLDAESAIRLADLSADHVEVEQVSGTVYSRVVANSERHYVIATDDATYEALGTAFVTTKTTTKSGVQVYHSSVKTSLASESVSEGKQCYKAGDDASSQSKITDINIDELVDDTFINWNLSEDEKDTSFKDKLGVLPQIKEHAEARERERQNAEEAAREQAEKEAAERAARDAEIKKQAEEEKQSNAPKGPVERGTMTLVNTGGTLRWTYTGKAIYGYKLVYSKKTTRPTFGKDSSIYFSDMATTSASLPIKNIDDGKYYVRICAYTAGTDPDGCVDYSNFVVMTLHK